MFCRWCAAAALVLMLCLLLFGCQKSGQGNEKSPVDSGEKQTVNSDVSLSLPENVYYISIARWNLEGGNGRAPIPHEELGVIRQLTDETAAAVLTPLPADTDRVFDDQHCYDINFYTEQAVLTIVSIDQNGLILSGNRTYTLKSGTLTYAHIESYYNAFCKN